MLLWIVVRVVRHVKEYETNISKSCLEKSLIALNTNTRRSWSLHCKCHYELSIFVSKYTLFTRFNLRGRMGIAVTSSIMLIMQIILMI